MKHVSDQNWLAVTLDLCVVILGIFIGMQVTEWNNTRLDHQKERHYLERISEDLKKDIQFQELAITLADRRMDYGHLLIDSIEDKDLAKDEPTRFIKALDQAGYSYTADIASTTFEEIKYSGDLKLIRNIDLRTKISNYYDLLETYEQWNFNRVHVQTTFNTLNAGILTPDQLGAYTPTDPRTFSREEANEAYQRFAERAQFHDWLPHTIESNHETKRNAQNGLAAAKELLASIQEELKNR